MTHALGVGGRDLSAEVGGLATLEALRRLDADDEVELVVLVSKPPAAEVATRVEEYAAGLATPVETALLGPGRPDLTAAAEATLRRLGVTPPAWPVAGEARPGRGGRLHGLFAGGTLCEEARLIAADAGVGGDAFTDFGDDDYTAGPGPPDDRPDAAARGAAAGRGRPGHRGGAARRGARPRRRPRPGRHRSRRCSPRSTSRPW